MCESWINKPWRYLNTRFPAFLYLPCAAFLVIAGIAGGRSLSPAGVALASVFALTLLLQFRLLDDLSDVAKDRRVYPDRVLAQAASLVPFFVMLCLCLVANFALVAAQPGPGHRSLVLLILNAAAVLWYCGLRGILAGKVLGYHVVMVKYPLFVFLLSGDSRNGWRLFLAMAMVYLCFSIYEALHDRDLQKTPGAVTALTLEIVVLFVVSALMTFEVIDSKPAIVLFQGISGLFILLVLSDLFLRRRIHLNSTKSSYAVFIGSFILILNFSIGARL